MVGGVDMLAAGRRDACLAMRSFGEIAVLCRTRRQLDRLERTLARAGIPCQVAGRGDYLTAACVHGVLSFLRFLKKSQDTAALRTALRAVWTCPEDRVQGFAAQYEDVSADVSAQELISRGAPYAEDGRLRLVLREIETLSPDPEKGKTGQLLTDWAERHGLSDDADFTQFIQLGAFYKDIFALLDGVLLGSEGDFAPQKQAEI